MEKVLLLIFGIACLIQLIIVIVACARGKIADKQNQDNDIY
jgi:hypothetical protein